MPRKEQKETKGQAQQCPETTAMMGKNGDNSVKKR